MRAPKKNDQSEQLGETCIFRRASLGDVHAERDGIKVWPDAQLAFAYRGAEERAEVTLTSRYPVINCAFGRANLTNGQPNRLLVLASHDRLSLYWVEEQKGGSDGKREYPFSMRYSTSSKVAPDVEPARHALLAGFGPLEAAASMRHFCKHDGEPGNISLQCLGHVLLGGDELVRCPPLKPPKPPRGLHLTASHPLKHPATHTLHPQL